MLFPLRTIIMGHFIGVRPQTYLWFQGVTLYDNHQFYHIRFRKTQQFLHPSDFASSKSVRIMIVRILNAHNKWFMLTIILTSVLFMYVTFLLSRLFILYVLLPNFVQKSLLFAEFYYWKVKFYRYIQSMYYV